MGAVASPPHPQALQRDALMKARGDIFAGEIKFVKDVIRRACCMPHHMHPCWLFKH